jgi:hypothetical protein
VVRKTFETGKVIEQRDGALYTDGQLLISADETTAALRAGRYIVAKVVARETTKRFAMALATVLFGVVMMIFFVYLHGYFSWPMLAVEAMAVVGTVVTWRHMHAARARLDRLDGKASLPVAKTIS